MTRSSLVVLKVPLNISQTNKQRSDARPLCDSWASCRWCYTVYTARLYWANDLRL